MVRPRPTRIRRGIKGGLEKAFDLQTDSQHLSNSLNPPHLIHTYPPTHTSMDAFATLFTSNAPESETIRSTPIDADGNASPGIGCIIA